MTRFLAAVPCNQLIAPAVSGTGDSRTEYAELLNALGKCNHIRIIPYAIGILRVWMKLPYGDAVYFTYGFCFSFGIVLTSFPKIGIEKGRSDEERPFSKPGFDCSLIFE